MKIGWKVKRNQRLKQKLIKKMRIVRGRESKRECHRINGKNDWIQNFRHAVTLSGGFMRFGFFLSVTIFVCKSYCWSYSCLNLSWLPQRSGGGSYTCIKYCLLYGQWENYCRDNPSFSPKTEQFSSNVFSLCKTANRKLKTEQNEHYVK